MMRIALVDDHAVVREGYRALMVRQADMTVIAEFSSAASAYTGLKDVGVDIVVMDLNMPGAGALATLSRLHRRHLRLVSLVFTMYATASFARQAFAAGARGYVTKSSEPEVLLRALREISAGRRYLSADIAQLLALERFGDERGSLDSLSMREFEVLRLLLEGRDVSAIATVLNLSAKTIRNVHYAIKRKLGVRDDIELVRLAVRLNVVDLLDLADESRLETSHVRAMVNLSGSGLSTERQKS